MLILRLHDVHAVGHSAAAGGDATDGTPEAKRALPDAPTFLELSVDQMAVRSHALPMGASALQRSQTFAMPLPVAGTSSAPQLCATLCEADGDGGGRPIALAVIQPDVFALPPHEPVELTSALVTPPSENVLPYCLPLGHLGKRAQDARAHWREASRRVLADDGDGSDGGGSGRCRIRVTAQWRPSKAEGTSDDGGARTAAVAYDALGFPLDAAAPNSPRRSAPPSQHVAKGLGDAKWARSAAGGWWQPDALNLCRWNAAICSCGSLAEMPIERIRCLIAAGVPMQHRMHVWEWCADALPLRESYAPEELLGGGGGGGASGDGGASGGGGDAAFDAAAKVVEMDLLRTFPSHPLLATASSALVAPLRRLLLTFARYNPAVSYCQSLNFLAAVLLLHGDEAGAFALLAALCDSLMPGFHRPSMDGLHIAQAALVATLQAELPAVHRRLTKESIPVTEQTTSWLLCAFIDALPLEATLRAWDLTFLDGHAALVRTAAAAFALHEDHLLHAADVFDLRLVLMCDAGELSAASLAPPLVRAVERALSDALAAAGLDEPPIVRRTSSVRSGATSRDTTTADDDDAPPGGGGGHETAAASEEEGAEEWMEDY